MTFVLHGPVDPSSPLFVGRSSELDTMKVWLEQVTCVGAVMGARQTGKTSLMLRLRHTCLNRYAFVYADLQAIEGADRSACFEYLAAETRRQLKDRLTDKIELTQPTSDGFLDFLAEISRNVQAVRIGLLVDEVGALPMETAVHLAHTIRAAFTTRIVRPELARFAFLLAGSVDMLELTGKSMSPLWNVTESLYPSDFSVQDTAVLLAHAFSGRASVDLELLAGAIHAWTSGHPYWTQRLAASLPSVELPNVSEAVNDAAEALLDTEETNLPYVVRRLDNGDPRLWKIVEDVSRGVSVPFHRQDPIAAELELLGIIKGVKKRCTFRNQIYQRAVERRLEVKPAVTIGPKAAPRALVMKGGGVKGLAYVGALEALEEYGYSFQHFVGTSAGAISAALLASGYSSGELRQVLETTDFRRFKDTWLPFALIALPFRKGLYRGDEFKRWLEEHLRRKHPELQGALNIEFRHLSSAGRRLTIFASSTERRAVCFDSSRDGDAEQTVAFACRCSMAIPYFFVPERVGGKHVFDGGMQNNYPIYALFRECPDYNSESFVGLYLGKKTVERTRRLVLQDLLSIWSEAGDEEALSEYIHRTVVIDPRPVRTTDFSLSGLEKEFLLAEGRGSALRWLHHYHDGKRPSQEDVIDAEVRAMELRRQVVSARWRRIWPVLLASLAILAGLLFLGIWRFS